MKQERRTKQPDAHQRLLKGTSGTGLLEAEALPMGGGGGEKHVSFQEECVGERR